MLFTQKQIITEADLSTTLKKARELKILTIEDVSNKINIKKQYLEALENAAFDILPSGIYAKIFLKKYASFLGLNKNELVKKFEESYKKKEKDIFAKEKIKKIEFFVFPKIIRITLIVLIIFFFFSYLSYHLYLSLSSPAIKIIQPEDNLITSQNSINIIGKTSQKTDITINNKQILKNEQGLFEEKIDLKNGINTIVIIGKNKYSKETLIEKQILVK